MKKLKPSRRRAFEVQSRRGDRVLILLILAVAALTAFVLFLQYKGLFPTIYRHPRH